MMKQMFSRKNVAMAILILAAGILYLTSSSSFEQEWKMISGTEERTGEAADPKQETSAGLELSLDKGAEDASAEREPLSLTADGLDLVFVHVAGAVYSPGVYQVESGARVYQVIELAGGLTEEADRDFLNMAQLVSDGQKITVYTKEEVEAGEVTAPVLGTDAGSLEKEKVNLNTADREALMELTGIGEAKADAILAYRTKQGAFHTIEEIMEVPGIKAAAFEKIKNDITV